MEGEKGLEPLPFSRLDPKAPACSATTESIGSSARIESAALSDKEVKVLLTNLRQNKTHLRAKRTDSTVKPSRVVRPPTSAGAISMPVIRS